MQSTFKDQCKSAFRFYKYHMLCHAPEQIRFHGSLDISDANRFLCTFSVRLYSFSVRWYRLIHFPDGRRGTLPQPSRSTAWLQNAARHCTATCTRLQRMWKNSTTSSNRQSLFAYIVYLCVDINSLMMRRWMCLRTWYHDRKQTTIGPLPFQKANCGSRRHARGTGTSTLTTPARANSSALARIFSASWVTFLVRLYTFSVGLYRFSVRLYIFSVWS